MKNKPLTHLEVASNGGKARAKKLTPERRKEIAMMGVKARLDNIKKSSPK